MTAIGKIQKAKGYPLIGNTLSAIKDPLGFMVSLRRNYDDVVRIQIGGKNYIVIQSPETCRHVLQENAKNYYKPGAARMMKKVMGNGLATSNGDLWLKQRRLMQPAFHRKKIEGLYRTIQEETADLIQSWKEVPLTKRINVSEAFQHLTLINITKTMFGSDLKHDVNAIAGVINEMIDSASSIITSLIKVPLSIPTPSNLRFARANRKFEKIIYGIIQERKIAKKENSQDLLDLLLHAYDDESKSYMTDQQLRDEITTVFMAGHETTAQTLSWVFYHLALNPSIYQKLREESNRYFENEVGLSALQELTATKCAIEETMRLYPPVWVIARKSIADDVINGFLVPSNSTVLINVYGMNHSPRYWTSPELFNPARFQNGSEQVPFTYIPFGGGQRQCIGKLFAMMVMQTVVCGLVHEFEFNIPPGFKPITEPGTTLRAKGGIQLLLTQHLNAEKNCYANSGTY